MFFILSKILSFLIKPITYIFLFLIAGFIFKQKKIKKSCFFISIILSLFFTNPFIINTILRGWEYDVKLISNTKHHKAGIVLGGILHSKPRTKDRLYFNPSADRLFQAIWLYRKGKIDKILLSGGAAIVIGEKIPEAPKLKKFLIKCNIPEKDILVEGKSRNTRENAMYSSKILKKKMPDKKFLLITSASHMRRAIACFNKTGVQVTPFPVDFKSKPISFMPERFFLPSASAMSKWNAFFHEIAGFMGYKLMGYI